MSEFPQDEKQASFPIPWTLCVAPMMDWTDRHCRYFHRLISPSARLYTEMVTTAAILHGRRSQLLQYDPSEHPLALQLGGHEPAELAEAARIGADYGYDEINLNVGCPSDRVQSGRFGACLMREPALVAECIAAMRAAVKVPVTVKCRIGVDQQDEYADLHGFAETVLSAGCAALIVHARKAWLHGLSPKENREVPPLNYERVYQLKREFPHVPIIINGGITDVAAVYGHLNKLDGVMLGRAAYHDPYILALLDAALTGKPLSTRAAIISRLRPYLECQLRDRQPLARVTRHILGLYLGQPGARAFRRILSERAHKDGAGFEVVAAALAAVDAAGTERLLEPHPA